MTHSCFLSNDVITSFDPNAAAFCRRFYGPFDFLGVVTAAIMGLQHALAMAGGLVRMLTQLRCSNSSSCWTWLSWWQQLAPWHCQSLMAYETSCGTSKRPILHAAGDTSLACWHDGPRCSHQKLSVTQDNPRLRVLTRALCLSSKQQLQPASTPVAPTTSYERLPI